jgi:beta-galactosidase
MNKQIFDLGWEYTETTGMMAMMLAKWQKVNLPHDAMIAKPRQAANPTGSGGGYFPSGVITYRKKFDAPPAWSGQSVILEFEGVYMNAEVSLNNQLLALHPYGYTSFLVNLSPHLKIGQQNELTVSVNNSAQPNSRWYSGTGIYRHVWLRTGPAGHISPWGVFIRSDGTPGAGAVVKVTTELTACGAGAVLRSTILNTNGSPLTIQESPVQSETVEQIIELSSPTLWSIETPYLYNLRSELLLGGQVIDQETTPFGIRTIAMDAVNGFRLNGVPLKLKGGCVHHDNGLLGAASFDRAEERKIELMKAAGYNAVRCAHNPPAPAFLDACDRLGMLVIDETFDCWRMGKNLNDYHLYFEDWWQRDTTSMVLRDRNHPSIILWSIGNEVPERTGVSDGAAWARKQGDLIRTFDPTRGITAALPFLFEPQFNSDDENPPIPAEPVNLFDPGHLTPKGDASDVWGRTTREFNDALDLVGYNYLVPRYEYDGKRFPSRVIAGTETFPHFLFENWSETLRLPHVIGDFVWTSLDYLGESGIGAAHLDGGTGFSQPFPYHLATCGDIDICGFKRPQSYYRDILWGERKAPFIGVIDPAIADAQIRFMPWGWEPVIDSWTFPGQEGKPTRVEIYSSDDEVELFINNQSVGRKTAGKANRNKAVFEVNYQPGEIRAVSNSGQITLTTTGQPAALRLTADRPTIQSAWGDLVYITVEITDNQGQRVIPATDEINLTTSGVGELIALGSGDPKTEELYIGSSHKAYLGRLMVILRSNGETGSISLRAAAPGLTSAEITIQA